MVDQWVFNLEMETPKDISVDALPGDKRAVVVLQSAAISPLKLTWNVSY